jgi:hypothetical protein
LLPWNTIFRQGCWIAKTLIIKGIIIDATASNVILCLAKGYRAKTLKKVPMDLQKLSDGLMTPTMVFISNATATTKTVMTSSWLPVGREKMSSWKTLSAGTAKNGTQKSLSI